VRVIGADDRQGAALSNLLQRTRRDFEPAAFWRPGGEEAARFLGPMIETRPFLKGRENANVNSRTPGA